MSIFDKLIDTMHIGSEDDYDDYDDDFEDDDFEDELPRKRSVFKKKEKDFDYDLEDDLVEESSKIKPAKQQAKIKPMRSRKGGNGMEL